MKSIVFRLFFLFTSFTILAQDYTHEIGGIVGPVMLLSDYGERGSLENNIKNASTGFGLIYYYNFNQQSNRSFAYNSVSKFLEYTKIRLEVSYHKTDFQHNGKYVEPSKTSVFANQLRAMRGSTAVANAGLQVEFFPLSIHDLETNPNSFNPYISVGFQYSYFQPKAWSTLGEIRTSAVTPTKYMNALKTEANDTFSAIAGLGVRYNLNDLTDLLIETRLQKYFSDDVDGLNPSKHIYQENKVDDYAFWINFGVVFYVR